MAVDRLYKAVLGSLTLSQLGAARFTNSATPILGAVPGLVDPQQYFGGPSDQRATFDTSDVHSVAGVSNVCTAGIGVSSGTISLTAQKTADLSTFAGAGSHVVVSAANGLVIPRSFSVSEDADATCSLETVFKAASLATGDTNPVSIATAQSISGAAFNKLHRLGPVSINGSVIDRVRSFTVNPGISIEPLFFNKLYPSEITIVQRQPTIDIEFYDYNELSSFAAGFTVGTALVAYMQERSGLTVASDGTATHVRFSFADGMVNMEDLSINGREAGTCTLRFYGEALTCSVGAIT